MTTSKLKIGFFVACISGLFSCRDRTPTYLFEVCVLAEALPMDSLIPSQLWMTQKGKYFERPAGTRQKIISLLSSNKVFEVYYKVPQSKGVGILSLEHKSEVLCQLEKVNRVSLKIKNNDKTLSYFFNGHESKITFKERNPITFFSTSPQRVSREKERAEDYQSQRLVPCHVIDKNCREAQPFTCQYCPWGWFEVPDHVCPKQGGDKYCGVLNCGAREQLACLRGYTYQNLLSKDPCDNADVIGFCQKGLRPTCDQNKRLVCL